MKHSSIVIGLGYGDEGKGRVVRALSEASDSGYSGIRFGGGHQVGHTAYMDVTKRHTFSNFSAVVFNKGATIYLPDTIVYPFSAVNEYNLLKQNFPSLEPTILIDKDVKVCTTFDFYYNRQIESLNNHGSVGVGINATIERDKVIPLRGYDLEYPNIYREKLRMIKNYYLNLTHQKVYEDAIRSFESLIHSVSLDLDREVIDLKKYLMFAQVIHSTLYNFPVIYEGHQGIMLDQQYGYNPHTTPSYTTIRQAVDHINKNDFPIDIYYVMRAYSTRHGYGPFRGAFQKVRSNTSIDSLLVNTETETNRTNKFQKTFMTGYHSLEELEYALTVGNIEAKKLTVPVKTNLVITCLDQTNNKVLMDEQRYNVKDFLYQLSIGFNNVYLSNSPFGEIIKL